MNQRSKHNIYTTRWNNVILTKDRFWTKKKMHCILQNGSRSDKVRSWTKFYRFFFVCGKLIGVLILGIVHGLNNFSTFFDALTKTKRTIQFQYCLNQAPINRNVPKKYVDEIFSINNWDDVFFSLYKKYLILVFTKNGKLCVTWVRTARINEKLNTHVYAWSTGPNHFLNYFIYRILLNNANSSYNHLFCIILPYFTVFYSYWHYHLYLALAV